MLLLAIIASLGHKQANGKVKTFRHWRPERKLLMREMEPSSPAGLRLGKLT